MEELFFFFHNASSACWCRRRLVLKGGAKYSECQTYEMWTPNGRKAMRIFFIAHPGQIDCLCCGHSLLSVYNVAFALHCPDPATPKGNWFLPLRCPFTSPSSLVVFPFSLIPSSFFPISFCSFFSLHFLPFTRVHTHIHTHQCLYDSALSSSFFVLHFIRSFALLPPSGSLVMPACFIALYSISKPPASLRFSIPPHTRSAPGFVFLHCHSVPVFLLLPLSSPLLCLHPPSV